jgi:hypothetical protein
MIASGGVIERYELKYRLPPDLVDPIREALMRYCVPDEAAAGERYLISSLYLDTPDHRLYRETIDQAARRFKLRVRRYERGPVFLEIKRRLKDVIVKSRVAVPPDSWPGLMLDPAVEASLKLSPAQRADVTRFVNTVLRIDARPAAVVRYAREAFVSEVDDYARATFDLRIDGRPPEGWSVPIADGPQWVPVDAPSRFGLPMSGVVLELKATTAVPAWMTDIVRRFGLKREGFSKYCSVLEMVAGVGERGPGWRDAEPGRWARGLPA